MTGEDENKNRIISAALRKLMAQGIKNLKMDDLAQELGISKKTIYRYFSSKDELVKEIARFIMTKIAAEQNELMDKAHTPFEKVFALFAPVYRMLPRFNRGVIEEMARMYPEIWDELNTYRLKRLMLLKGILAEGIQAGVFRQVDPQIAASFLVITITNFVQPENLMLLGITPREAFEFLVSSVFLGIVCEERRDDFLRMMQTATEPALEPFIQPL